MIDVPCLPARCRALLVGAWFLAGAVLLPGGSAAGEGAALPGPMIRISYLPQDDLATILAGISADVASVLELPAAALTLVWVDTPADHYFSAGEAGKARAMVEVFPSAKDFDDAQIGQLLTSIADAVAKHVDVEKDAIFIQAHVAGAGMVYIHGEVRRWGATGPGAGDGGAAEAPDAAAGGASGTAGALGAGAAAIGGAPDGGATDPAEIDRLVTAGTVVLCIGAAGMLAGFIGLGVLQGEDPHGDAWKVQALPALAGGLGLAVAGGITLGVGLFRRGRAQAPEPTIQPTVWLDPRGAGAGFVGRF